MLGAVFFTFTLCSAASPSRVMRSDDGIAAPLMANMDCASPRTSAV